MHVNKEWYYIEYWDKERSLKEIGAELGVHAQTVLNRMKKFGIPRRSSKKHSKKTINKMSVIKQGKKNPMFGRKRPKHSKKMKKIMKGRKFSKETRKKMSEAKKGICGHNHNKWIDPDKRKGSLNKNIRRLRKMAEWRKAIFKRDKYTCQNCGTQGVYLQADHIKPLHFLIVEYKITKPSDAIKEPRFWDLLNGRTLCIECHKLTDTFGAKIRKTNGYTREYK